MLKSLSELVHWPEKDIYFGVDPIKVDSVVHTENYQWWKEFNSAESFYSKDYRWEVSPEGILSFKEVMQNLSKYTDDEDLYVAYMLIPVPDELKSINDWAYWPSERKYGAPPLQYSEYVKPFRSRGINPFLVVDGKKYMVLISVTFMVKLNQLYAPMGISKSSWALMLDAKINTVKRQALISTGEYKRVSGISKRFHALIAAFVVKCYKDTIKIMITRPTYAMTEIIHDALRGRGVSLGSVKDRRYLETHKQETMDHESVKALRNDFYETIESTGRPVLDDTEEGTWRFTTSSNPAFHTRDWDMEIPNFWMVTSVMYGCTWLPMVIVDIHDLASNASPTASNTSSAGEPLKYRLNECRANPDIAAICRALHRRITALESRFFGSHQRLLN
jgi:hypothetical protein